MTVKTKPALIQDLSLQNVSSGLISSTLIMTGPAAIILEAAANAAFTSAQTVSWLFAVYFFGGLFGVWLSLHLKIPVTGGHSISAVAFLAAAAPHFTYHELIGGFMLSGLIIFFTGASGLFTHIIKWVPKQVVAAMLAGLITSYVVRLVFSLKELPAAGGTALLTFFIVARFSKRVPPVLAAVLAAFAALLVTSDFTVSAGSAAFFLPSLQAPDFTWAGFFTLAVPLALLVLSNDAAPGISALESAGFKPPVRKIISASGLFSLCAAIFGGQSANIAGMMTAICASEESGSRSGRYIASFISGAATLLFGLFAWKIAPFITALPPAFVSLVAGLALIGALQSSLQAGFSGNKHSLSSLFAFIVALSGVSFFHISAPVWALVIGTVLARTVEAKNEQ